MFRRTGRRCGCRRQDLDKARLATTAKGGPKSGRMGFELFDNPNWMGSEFDEKVNYQRALEGELEHTIATLASVAVGAGASGAAARFSLFERSARRQGVGGAAAAASDAGRRRGRGHRQSGGERGGRTASGERGAGGRRRGRGAGAAGRQCGTGNARAGDGGEAGCDAGAGGGTGECAGFGQPGRGSEVRR